MSALAAGPTLPGLLELAFMQRALVATTAICAAAPVVGTFIVQRRQALIGEGMGHVALAGVGAAFLLGGAPILGAAAMVVVGAVVLHRLQRSGVGGDLSLAIVFYASLALGYLLAARSGMGINSVVGVLFGSPLNLTWSQTWSIVALSALVVGVVAVLYGALTSIAFDEQAARVSGLPVDRVVLALTVLVGLVVVGGMHAVGLLLIAAMMVIPVAAAQQLASGHRQAMLLAGLVGAGCAVVGLVAAYHLDLAPGASVVLVAVAAYAAATVGRRLADRTRRRDPVGRTASDQRPTGGVA